MTKRINQGIFNALVRPAIILETLHTHMLEKDDSTKDRNSGNRDKIKHIDPEYERTISFAKTHYSDYEDDQMAFNKYVQRNLMHTKQENKEQSTKIKSIENSIERLRDQLDALQSNDDSSTFEEMLPKSVFAGSKKNKLGPAGHLTGKMRRPARSGDLVGGMEEAQQVNTRDNKQVQISEDVERLMGALIEKIVKNEAIQNNNRKH